MVLEGLPDEEYFSNMRDVEQAALALDEAERELWKQLRRKRDFESRVAEKRVQLAELQDRRRTISIAHAEAAASVEYLMNELKFAREQEREMEHDIAVLKESNQILQNAFQLTASPGASEVPTRGRKEAKDALAQERMRRESVQSQHDQISHLRAHLDRLRAERSGLQQRQQALFDKQRAAEQDRNRLIGTLQDERSGINELRSQRIKLWEEKASMEREMSQIVRDVQAGISRDVAATRSLTAPRPSLPQFDSEAKECARVPGAAGGVRGHVSTDTPLVFANVPWE